MRFERIAVKGLFEECLDSRIVKAEERRITLETFIEDPEATLSGDRRLLRVAVSNLVDMAIRRNKSGGKVVIGYSRDPARESIVITDTGSGIPLERLRSIRDLFCRASTPCEYDVDEADLDLQGLHIVKDIADIHHGRIGVRSMEGEGSTFTLHLPRHSNGAA